MALRAVPPDFGLKAFGLGPDAEVTLNSSGFSGDNVWRVNAPPAVFALKAHSLCSHSVLARIHSLLLRGRDAGVHELPRVFLMPDGNSAITNWDGLVWDLVSWQPGEAIHDPQPTRGQCRSAGEVLARLHLVWKIEREAPRPCPGVLRRLSAFDEWQSLPAREKSPLAASIDSILNREIPSVRPSLELWLDRPVPVQFCHGDPWHGHFLFAGDVVTGLVDHAAVKLDHVAADLARLLGSLVIDVNARSELMAGYESVRQLNSEDRQLAASLEHSGIVASLARWRKQLSDGIVPDRHILRRIDFLMQQATRAPN